MLIEHGGKRPTVHASARIAPTAVLCGDVTIGAATSIGFGAVLTAESGPIVVGSNCVIMENAVLRGTKRALLALGDNILVGPGAHLSGCRIEDDVFIATGVSVFPHARIGARSTVRIGAVVHIHAQLPEESSVPILHVAFGDPPEIAPPSEYERILDHLAVSNFGATVFGVERKGGTYMPEAMARYTRALARHREDTIVA